MIYRQVASAVDYLHGLDLAHRDLKCENIMLMADNRVKLGDFGFARHCKTAHGEEIMSKTFCGSSAYAAPEIIQVSPIQLIINCLILIYHSYSGS